MNEDQQQEARAIWITNIDKETHIYNPDEVSDKLDRLDTTGRAE